MRDFFSPSTFFIVGVFLVFVAACEPVPVEVEKPQAGEEQNTDDAAPSTSTPDEEGVDLGLDVAEAQDPQSGVLIVIGSDIASLGDADTSGLWVKSKLVSVEEDLVLYHPETMRKITLRAYPSDGLTQMSIDVYQELGLSPADLVEIELARP